MKKKHQQKQKTLLSFFSKPASGPPGGVGGGEAEERQSGGVGPSAGAGPRNAERTNGGGRAGTNRRTAPSMRDGTSDAVDEPQIAPPPANDAGGEPAPDLDSKTEDGSPPDKADKLASNGSATDSTHPTSGESEEEGSSSDEGESDSDDEEESDAAGGGAVPDLPPAGPDPDGKSAYELLRERNIARNNARLRELGLATDEVEKPMQRKRPAAKRRRVARTDDGPPAPARRSRRLRRANTKAVDGASSVADTSESAAIQEEVEPEPEPELEEFTVSPLFEYHMAAYVARMEGKSEEEAKPQAAKNETAERQPEGGRIATLVPTGTRLNPPSGLNAIYTLQFRPDPDHDGRSSWIVGGGKAGIVALWDASRPANEHDVIDPVVSFRGHSGRWIADARFVPAGDVSASSGAKAGLGGLLTAGNDGTVCHWDLASTSVKTGAPRLLGQSGKGLHASGIFSMDVSLGGMSGGDVKIVTGSKDKTLAVTSLDRMDGKPVWRSDRHSAKVGCVSFPTCDGGDRLVASASDDGLVAVHDVRSNKKGSTIVLEGAHVKPHSAVWKPGSDQVLATAGLDDTIMLWDLRNAKAPVATYHGHVPGAKRLRRIHRPAFMSVGGETFLLSGGEGSGSVSMFRVDGRSSSGEDNGEREGVFSRGRLPDDAGDVGSVAVGAGGQVAIAVEGGEVLMLSSA